MRWGLSLSRTGWTRPLQVGCYHHGRLFLSTWIQEFWHGLPDSLQDCYRFSLNTRCNEKNILIKKNHVLIHLECSAHCVDLGDNWNGIMKDTLREECDSSEECLRLRFMCLWFVPVWPNSNWSFPWANIFLCRNCCVNQYFAPLFFVVFVLMAQFVSSPGNLHKIICISGVGQCGRCRAHETSWRKPQTGEDRVDWVLIMKLIPNQPGWRSGCMVCMFSF